MYQGLHTRPTYHVSMRGWCRYTHSHSLGSSRGAEVFDVCAYLYVNDATNPQGDGASLQRKGWETKRWQGRRRQGFQLGATLAAKWTVGSATEILVQAMYPAFLIYELIVLCDSTHTRNGQVASVCLRNPELIVQRDYTRTQMRI
jgi:hypothetical protein